MIPAGCVLAGMKLSTGTQIRGGSPVCVCVSSTTFPAPIAKRDFSIITRSSLKIVEIAVCSSSRYSTVLVSSRGQMLRRYLTLLGGACIPVFASSSGNFRRLPVEDSPFSLPGNLAPLSQSDPRWASLNASGFQYAVKPPGQGGASFAIGCAANAAANLPTPRRPQTVRRRKFHTRFIRLSRAWWKCDTVRSVVGSR